MKSLETLRLAAIAVASLALATPLAACSTSTNAQPARTASARPDATRSGPASSSPWHAVKDVGSFNATDVNFAAASATDAWSTWVTTFNGPGSAPATPQAVERWDGTTWQQVAVPASLVPHVRTSASVATD
jgi:hypothetical protein